jgi:DMSO/TMAO reductase YedYZ molybdopterin-dependent catalytic subunit
MAVLVAPAQNDRPPRTFSWRIAVSTNILLSDLRRDNVLIAYKHDGKELAPEHGGPCRLFVPHLYFWKSAKWARGLLFMADEKPGFWEMYGYHIRGDPWKEERYA